MFTIPTLLREIKSKKSDSERLIANIKKHECIWDSKHPGHRSKSKIKDEAWKEVAKDTTDEWDTLNRTEKRVATRYLLKRWNNIRDYYAKVIKARVTTGSGRTYVFSEALEFLRPTLEKNYVNQSSSLKVELSEKQQDSEKENEESEYNDIIFVDTFDQSHEEDRESKSQERLEYTSTSRTDDDADLMFLKSLLPDMKKLQHEEKIEFKCAIMQAYRDIVTKRKSE